MGDKKLLIILKRIVVCLTVLISQFVFADQLRIFGVSPNIVFAFIISIAFIDDISYNTYASVLMGVCLDALSGRIFGIYLLTFVVINFLVQELYHSAFSENFIIETIYGLIATFSYSLLFSFFTSFFKGNFFLLFSRTGLIEWLYNFVIFEVFLIIHKKNRKKHNKGVFRV